MPSRAGVGRQIGEGLLGDADGRGLRVASPVRCSTAASRSACLMARWRVWPRRRSTGPTSWSPGSPARSSCRSGPSGWPAPGGRCGGLPRGGHPRRHLPYDFVAGQCASGLARVALDTGIPVIFGVLTTENVDQALERARPDETNKGREAAQSAVQMAGIAARPRPERPGTGRPIGGGVACSGSSCPRFARSSTLDLFADADLRVYRSSDVDLPGQHPRRPDHRRHESSGPRRSPSTSPRACSTSASPGATGSRSRGPRSSRLGELPYSKVASGYTIRIVLAVARGLAVHVARGSERRGPAAARRDRVPRAGPPGPETRPAWTPRSPLLRRHRGQGARHRRLRGRADRDRPGACGRPGCGSSTRSSSRTPS